eukprot:5548386-Prymnesium_polylepis.1
MRHMYMFVRELRTSGGTHLWLGGTRARSRPYFLPYAALRPTRPVHGRGAPGHLARQMPTVPGARGREGLPRAGQPVRLPAALQRDVRAVLRSGNMPASSPRVLASRGSRAHEGDRWSRSGPHTRTAHRPTRGRAAGDRRAGPRRARRRPGPRRARRAPPQTTRSAAAAVGGQLSAPSAFAALVAQGCPGCRRGRPPQHSRTRGRRPPGPVARPRRERHRRPPLVPALKPVGGGAPERLLLRLFAVASAQAATMPAAVPLRAHGRAAGLPGATCRAPRRPVRRPRHGRLRRTLARVPRVPAHAPRGARCPHAGLRTGDPRGRRSRQRLVRAVAVAF